MMRMMKKKDPREDDDAKRTTSRIPSQCSTGRTVRKRLISAHLSGDNPGDPLFQYSIVTLSPGSPFCCLYSHLTTADESHESGKLFGTERSTTELSPGKSGELESNQRPLPPKGTCL